MNTTHALSQNALVLAGLLQRLESRSGADAGQYRDVVARLTRELTDVAPGAALDELLAAAPVAAEIYENLNYQHAGLCRSPLEASLAAELSARELIAQAMRPTAHRAPRHGA
jgi:hypothetical protein